MILLQSEIVRDRWYLDIDPAPVHQRYIDATNRGDVAGAVALFAEDAVYQGGSCQPDPCIGQIAIQGDIAGNVASHVHVTRISAQVDDDTLTWHSQVAADGVRAAGVDRIVTLGTTQVRDSTIVKHQFRFDMSDPQTAVYAAFLAQSQRNIRVRKCKVADVAGGRDGSRPQAHQAASSIGSRVLRSRLKTP